jgi:hypothetical protein
LTRLVQGANVRPMRVSSFSIPGGDSGTVATLRHMKRLARQGCIHPLTRQTAINITHGMGDVPLAQARTLREWLSQSILFQRYPYGVEALHAVDLMLRSILTTGTASLDCDDVAVLAAALGLTLGLRARFVAVGFKTPNSPFRHVWAELADPRRPTWVDCDITRPAQGLSGVAITRRLVMEA